MACLECMSLRRKCPLWSLCACWLTSNRQTIAHCACIIVRRLITLLSSVVTYSLPSKESLPLTAPSESCLAGLLFWKAVTHRVRLHCFGVSWPAVCFLAAPTVGLRSGKPVSQAADPREHLSSCLDVCRAYIVLEQGGPVTAPLPSLPLLSQHLLLLLLLLPPDCL